jgi:hypothetical protein
MVTSLRSKWLSEANTRILLGFLYGQANPGKGTSAQYRLEAYATLKLNAERRTMMIDN